MTAPKFDPPEAIEKLIEGVVAGVRDYQKESVRKRLRAGLVADISEGDLGPMYNNWLDCAAHPDDGESHHLELHAKFVRDLACYAITNRKEIAEGIIRIWISNDLDRRDYSSRLARGLLDGECAATKDFSNQTKERLREFASK